MIQRSSFLVVVALLAVLLLPLSAYATGTSASESKTLVRNGALVITMDPSLGDGPLGLIENGDVLFQGDRIVAVGPGLVDPEAHVIDATGKIVMPGFVDTHNHLWQSVIRGCGADQDVMDWLGNCVISVNGPTIGEHQAYALVRVSTIDLIATGVTTVLDHSHGFNQGFVRGNIRALSDSGLRFVFSYYGAPDRVADIKLVKESIIDPHPRATLHVGSHPTMAGLSGMTLLSDLAKELGVEFNVHLLENIAQRADEPVKALDLAGALGPSLVVNHAIHFTTEEIELLAKHDVRVTHNPLSNMRLASGVIRMSDLLAAGMKVGLGLDGGANDTSDMFNTMRTAVGLQRATHLRTDVSPTVEEVLRMATMGGAEVLDMQDEVGSLTPGKKADIIIINPATANFAPRVDWVSQIVFNGQPRNVEFVFVDGRALKADGELVGVSESTIVQAAEQAVRDVQDVVRARQ